MGGIDRKVKFIWNELGDSKREGEGREVGGGFWGKLGEVFCGGDMRNRDLRK